jgi:hypothetical protein
MTNVATRWPTVTSAFRRCHRQGPPLARPGGDGGNPVQSPKERGTSARAGGERRARVSPRSD